MAKRVSSLDSRKRVRRTFGHLSEVAQMPNLIDVQRSSYDQFLQVGITKSERTNTGLQEAFSSVFPIHDFAGRAILQFESYELEAPKYDVDECQQRGLTYASPLKVTLRLVVWEIDEDTGAKSIRDIKEQDVYMGDMPLMTNNGTFIINGTERVIVSQMHRSPGVFFDHDRGKTHSSGKYLFAARIIPYRGSWLDFEYDAKDILNVRIDRKRKLPATTFLMALPDAESEGIIAEAVADGREINPSELTGMSREDILSVFYEGVIYSRDGDSWKCEFHAATYAGVKLTRELINAETGKVAAEAGTKLTPRTIGKIQDAGLSYIRIEEADMLGRFVATDIVDMNTGIVLAEAGDEISEDMLVMLRDNDISELSLLGIDNVNIGPHLRNTWQQTEQQP